MRYKIYILALAIFLTLGTISASIQLGNLSHSIDKTYTESSALSGRINFSISSEPAGMLITAFDSSITLEDFLDVNSISCSPPNAYECTCFPSDCESSFSPVGEPSISKQYQIGDVNTKLFGVELKANISELTNFRFNVTTDSGTTCTNPIMIDLFDDGNIEYKSSNISNEECDSEDPYGCFILADKEGDIPIGESKICGKIRVSAAGGYHLGAKVIGTGETATFKMTISTSTIEKDCLIRDVTSSGEVFCKVVLDESPPGPFDAEVCIVATDGHNGKFKINFENNNTCGFLEKDNEQFPHDYEIFAKPLKYNGPAEFTFNDDIFDDGTNLSQLVYDHLTNRYRSGCVDGCIIPLRLYSGNTQTIIIKNLIADYLVQGQDEDGSNQRNITDLVSTEALFTSSFINYRLGPAQLLVPSISGEKNLELKIGNIEINENISVINITSIKKITPTQAAALVPTRFFALIDDASNISYTWNFGDNSLHEITTKNVVEHTYGSVGIYLLTVNITNSEGTSTKTVSINVVAPYDAINETIAEYRKNLKGMDILLFTLPDWITTQISKVVDTSDLKAAINRIELKYKLLFREGNDPELIKEMTKLNELNVPLSLDTSIQVKSSKFVQSSRRFNPEIIGEYGAGTPDLDKLDAYHGAVNRWFDDNIDIDFESKTYTFSFEGGSKLTALTHIKMKFNAVRSITELFIVIDGDTNNIKFLEDPKTREIDPTHLGVELRNLESDTKVELEFIHPDSIEALDPPVYVSPQFRLLELGFTPGVCNNNNMCDEGEDYKNCRVDCKPITRTIVFLLLLLFIGFIVYIALQEWYKRNYQKNLFKNPNELFNLINFMSNGERQRLSKDQIFKQLKPRKWKDEQLNYAWKKLHNKRTGMFEIPIFRFFEKKKLKSELAKRKSMGLA